MFRKLWTYLTEENAETKRQLIGVRFLVFLAVCVLLAPLVYHQFIPKNDPNTSKKELDSLKLMYVFKLDSLEKLRSLQNEEFNEVNNNTEIREGKNKPVSYPEKTKYSKTFKKKPLVKFNLNTVTVDELKTVNGIGDVLANRIVKYRGKLGGFYKKEQLSEVYGLEMNVIERVYAQMNDSLLKPHSLVKINSGTFKEVLSHPYLEYKDVQDIFNNRPIETKNVLCELLVNKCEKIEFYIDFEN